MQTVGGQTLTVFTETASGQSEADGSTSGSGPGPDKLALEGVVVQRAECRPAVSENYMKLKKLQIEESSKPVRLSQQLDKAVTTNYKPVSNHAYNLEYDKKKKEEGKRARADKQQVLDMLFSAFEKHQFYNIKDLVDITKQPVIYLKEILRDIGIYNVKGTHKNTWELRPEYRHYQGEEEKDAE
ncbi:general transcription factor IIF subunit 2 isoform X3 [Clupea harengus]|uniref:General transcription factor IIF subunit 2 n=1 Tax=Clupea harengus TaxID=7950 RepID=A0A6P8EQV6_CLUHA|nr:general transcription factor IIF subunit 2 isoform X3 [Clupea harengus]